MERRSVTDTRGDDNEIVKLLQGAARFKTDVAFCALFETGHSDANQVREGVSQFPRDMMVSSLMPNAEIHTARLTLRPYALTDIADLVRLAGAREVAATTLRIPHPYTEQDARDFIAANGGSSSPETRFAITRQNDGQFCGGIGFRVDEAQHHGELGYWLGVPYWGQGYATESARSMVDYGFDTLGLHRIYASYVTHNVASGRVLRKIGMRHEGLMREHVCKWGTFYDIDCYGILKADWEQLAR
jgi:ribosomal-protein-alanine N-acetyltransferase